MKSKLRLCHLRPESEHRPGDDRPEERPDLGRRDEVAAPAGVPTGRIEAVDFVIEREGHHLAERNRSSPPDLAGDPLFERVQDQPNANCAMSPTRATTCG